MKNMEEKTGCVRRDRSCRKAMEKIRVAAQSLLENENQEVVALAQRIADAAAAVEE